LGERQEGLGKGLPLYGEARLTALVASPEKKFTPASGCNSLDSPPGHQKNKQILLKNTRINDY
jgi:hypothetical protein